MFKGHGQTTLLSPLCCPLYIFWPIHLTNTKLAAGVAPNMYMVPIDFQVTCLMVKVKPLFWAQCVVHFIYINILLTCFGQVLLLQRNLNFAPWEAYIFLKHFLFLKYNEQSFKPLLSPYQYISRNFHSHKDELVRSKMTIKWPYSQSKFWPYTCRYLSIGPVPCFVLLLLLLHAITCICTLSTLLGFPIYFQNNFWHAHNPHVKNCHVKNCKKKTVIKLEGVGCSTQ